MDKGSHGRKDRLIKEKLHNIYRERDKSLETTFHGGVVRHDDALAPRDASHPDDDPGRGRIAVVHAIGGKLADFEER